MSLQDCGSGAARLPRWVRRRDAGIWVMVFALPLLLSEPAAHATEADPQWPSWLALSVIAIMFLAAGVVGTRRFEAVLEGADPGAGTGYALLAVQAAVTVLVVARSPESAML